MREFNPRPTEWLAENNFNWADQPLDYLSPIAYIEKATVKICSLMLPVWLASVLPCLSAGLYL